MIENKDPKPYLYNHDENTLIKHVDEPIFMSDPNTYKTFVQFKSRNQSEQQTKYKLGNPIYAKANHNLWVANMIGLHSFKSNYFRNATVSDNH